MSDPVVDPVVTDEETTEVTAGRKALDECEVAYADLTATETELGFGDCHCDWRAPLAQVEIYKKAMEVAEDEEKYTTDAYVPEGEELTAAAAAEKAESFHVATDKKKELLKEYYPEVFAERYPDEVGAEEEPAEPGE